MITLARAKAAVAHVLQRSASRLQTPFACYSPSRLSCLVEVEGAHAFIGYYDIQPFDHARRTMLAHVVSDAAGCAQIGIVDLETAQFRMLATTPCWCWQLGARLQRWDSEHVVFNAVEKGEPCARITDLGGRIASVLPWNIFALDGRRERAALVDFGLLYRHRPGYGYSVLAQLAAGKSSQVSRGIAIADTAARTLRSLIDVDQAWRAAVQNGILSPQLSDAPRYLNHPIFSPDGERVCFLLVVETGRVRRVAMMTSHADTGRIESVLPHSFSSHNWWIDNTSLLVFLYQAGRRRGRYAIWNTATGTLANPGPAWPQFDGHPSLSPANSAWVTDTYPDLLGNQRLFLIPALHSERAIGLARFRAPLGMSWDKCDLHPRLSCDGRLCAVDTAFSGRRKVAVLDLSATRMLR